MDTKELLELSTDLLSRYKKKATAASSAADKAGNTALADKRFKGVMKATKKQFANDAKSRNEETEIREGFVVRYHNAKGEHVNTSKLFADRESAEKHAARGKSIDKTDGKYTVHKLDAKGKEIKEDSETQLQTEETTVSKDSVDFYAKYLGYGANFNAVKKIQSELNESQIKDASEVNEEDLEEAWPGTPEYEKKFGTKSTGKFDSKKTSTGTVYTKKFKDDEGDDEKKPAADAAPAAPKKRGRPVGWRGTYKPRQPKAVKEAFEAIARLDEEDLEEFIQSLQLVEDQE